MNVRKATVEEFKKLWNYSRTTTYEYFLKNLSSENFEFWTVENNGELIGELYIVWDAIDKEEADGIKRAYLCAFRVKEEYQGKGIGSKLMKGVIERVKERGFIELTIGIDNDDYEKLFSMYKHFGFDIHIKKKDTDNHYLDANGNPVKYNESYKLIMSDLLDRTNVLVYIYKRNPFKVLVLRRNESPVGIWQPVSGGVEQGEDLLEAVKREVFEETGITKAGKITDMEYSFTFYVQSTKRVMIDYCYSLEVENNTIVKISNEHDMYQWLSYGEAIEIFEFDENKKVLQMLWKEVDKI